MWTVSRSLYVCSWNMKYKAIVLTANTHDCRLHTYLVEQTVISKDLICKHCKNQKFPRHLVGQKLIVGYMYMNYELSPEGDDDILAW